MASNLKYNQVANVTRRTWDAEAYEKKAKARKEAASEDAKPGRKNEDEPAVNLSDEEKEEFQAAASGAAGPEGSKRAFLKARKSAVDIDSKVGTTELVSVEQAATTSTAETKLENKDVVVKTGIGWHCRVCDCFLKDSLTYLDHINGRKHQRKLGYSMRVERTTKDQLKDRLSQLTKRKEESLAVSEEAVETNFDEIVKAKDEEAKRKKEERQRRKKERKQKLAQEEPKPTEAEEEEEEVEEEVNPDIAAMMGFSGFS